MQGWAIVDKQVGEDWNDVELPGAGALIRHSEISDRITEGGPWWDCRECAAFRRRRMRQRFCAEMELFGKSRRDRRRDPKYERRAERPEWCCCCANHYR